VYLGVTDSAVAHHFPVSAQLVTAFFAVPAIYDELRLKPPEPHFFIFKNVENNVRYSNACY